MNTKKLLALLLAVVIVLGLAACGQTGGDQTTDAAQTTDEVQPADEEQAADAAADDTTESTPADEVPTSITVEHAMGTTEVPYAPERVCVLDSNAMDFMVALELTDYVTCVQSPKGIPSYLEEYYNSETIILLERPESDERDEAAETTDPYESYYSIDADLIIGSADAVDAELYAVLSQIAPTIVTGYAIDNENGMYEGVKANARMIASIWGVEEKLDEVLVEYDAIYQELDEVLEGVTVVMMNSTMDSNRIQIVSNDDFESNSEKLEAERSGRILLDLGMVMYSNDAPEEVVQASAYERNTDADTQNAKNQVSADLIDQVAPEYVLLVDRNFSSIEEAKDEGYEVVALTSMAAYQEGKVYMLSYEGKTGASGLCGTFIQLDELAAIFLN